MVLFWFLPIFMSTKDSASIFWLFCTYILYIYNSQQKINYPRANYLPTIIYVRRSRADEGRLIRTEVNMPSRVCWSCMTSPRRPRTTFCSRRPEPSLVYTLFIFWSNFPQAQERSESGCFRSLGLTDVRVRYLYELICDQNNWYNPDSTGYSNINVNLDFSDQCDHILRVLQNCPITGECEKLHSCIFRFYLVYIHPRCQCFANPYHDFFETFSSGNRLVHVLQKHMEEIQQDQAILCHSDLYHNSGPGIVYSYGNCIYATGNILWSRARRNFHNKFKGIAVNELKFGTE